MLLCPSWHCFFLGFRVFVVNVHTPVMHPPVALMLRGSSTLTFSSFPCASNPKGISFMIFKWFPGNTTYANSFSALTFSCCFSFCFLGVSCVTFPVDVLKNDCSYSLPDWKSISWPFLWYNLWINMHPVLLSNLAAFSTCNSSNDSSPNHDPLFFQ